MSGQWTRLTKKKGGATFWVNMAQAKTVEPLPDGKGCRIVFMGGSWIEVSESWEDVVP